MAHHGWNWGYVGCPYYLRDNPDCKTIDCAGICDGAKKTTLTFRRMGDFENQIEVFCKKHWENCEVFRMLDAVYNEKE